MSSGRFIISRYQRANGDIHPILIQPETITPWNPAPAGDATNDIQARVSGSKRGAGLIARHVSVSFRENPPTGYAPFSTIRLPILTVDAFAALSKGDRLAYQNGTVEVVGKKGGTPAE